MIRAAVAALLALAACGTSTTELVDDGLPGLISLSVTPGTSRVDLDDLGTTHQLDFVATGRFADGPDRDVTADVAWSTDRPAAGGFAAPGRWIGSNRSGGPVAITARSGAITGTAALEIHVHLDLTDPAFPPPPGAGDLFGPATPVVTGDPTRSPGIVYPAHEVMFPLGLHRILFQHDPGAVADVLQLRFASTFLDVTVLTTADRWQPEPQVWDLLSNTSAGDHLAYTLAGVEVANPVAVYASAPIELHYAADPAPGVIYYWSEATAGIMRGALAQVAPAKFYTQPPDTTCVGCHAVSRDGTRLAVGYDGERLQEVALPARTTILPRGRDAGWSTFSPDGRRLLIAHKGKLTLLDADTGDPIGPMMGEVQVPDATHPDWSPRGDFVVVAQCAANDNNRDVDGCSIVRIPYANDAWGAPEVLVAAAGGMDNNYFPRYSPDGAWIAYVRATGKSKEQPTAELRLLPANGGAPFTLARANHRVGPRDDVAGIANAMPAWAPAGERGIQWLVFSSRRDYGVVPLGGTQLWIAALDLTRTGDPSHAAFWVPFQDPGTRNHRPIWAIDPDAPCAAIEACDGFDNDCNGVVDDDCVPCTEVDGCVE